MLTKKARNGEHNETAYQCMLNAAEKKTLQKKKINLISS